MEDFNEPSDEEILASLEEKPAEEPVPQEGDAPNLEGEATEADGFQFKSLDELMGHNLKYTANGKDVEEPISTVLKRASQGYHYAQRMGELNSQETEWKRQLEESKGIADKYSQIDDYARQNPEWFDHWNNAYQNKDLPVGNGSPEQPQTGFDPAQITSLIDQKLAPFQDTIQQQQERIQQEKVDQENAALDKQVDATRQEFGDIDFSATSPETGATLESQVYQFMVDNNLGDFNKAYKLMDYDNIMVRQAEKAKQDLVKQEQMKRKQGIVAETSGQAKTPAAVDLRTLTHDQEQALLLQELEQLRSTNGG